MDASHDYGGTYGGICKADGPASPNAFPETVPDNARILRNLAMGSNYLMSHILHFYHLVALDYVDVNGTGLIPKGFTCPNYDNNYYARGIDPILQTAGLTKPAYSVNALDYGTASWKNTGGGNTGAPVPGADWNPSSGPAFQPALGDLTAYFAGQYVRALKIRRMTQQLGALFTGKMPHASAYTPAGMTTKVYDPTIGGSDAGVVQKVHELLYGGPGFDPAVGGTHPYNGQPLSMSMPHPESIMGFIGKPSDFWVWASTATPYDPGHLPLWAAVGVPGAGASNKCWGTGYGGSSNVFTGTFCFDTVAAAHVFPEYFWIGTGYNRFLAWGIFEGANPPLANTPDNRLITRGRVHLPVNLNGSGTPYGFGHHVADHEKTKEFTTNGYYAESSGVNFGRHMWPGKTLPVPMNHPWLGANKPNAYTYAKTPRYLNNESAAGSWEDSSHPNDAYLPYEVGPLARMMSNAVLIGGGPATPAQVLAVDAGQVGLYYPGVLQDVDQALETVLGISSILPGNGIGVLPGWGANATGHLSFLQTAVPGSPALYLPPNAMSAAVLTNAYAYDYMGSATLDRIAARTLETYYVGAQMLSWFNQLDPPGANTGAKKSGDPGYDPAYPYDSRWPSYTRKFGPAKDKPAPFQAQGAGLTEAPRGALGHWIRIYKGKTYNYQIITPTTWNINPKDALDPAEKTLGLNGPIEMCILNTPVVNDAEPIEILRVIHSFDPCCACTVHVMNAKKETKFKRTLEALI